jgi:hypothetical protein
MRENDRVLARGFLITLMMEAARTSETSVNFYQTTRRYNPEDSYLLELFWFSVELCNDGYEPSDRNFFFFFFP